MMRFTRLGRTVAAAAVAAGLAAGTARADFAYVRQFGSGGTGPGQFNGPNYMATDANGNVFVTDFSNSRVQEFSNTGNFLGAFGSAGSGNGQFIGPFAVATFAGNVFVTDELNNRVQVFGPTAVPEPGSLGLAATGASIILGASAWKSRRRGARHGLSEP